VPLLPATFESPPKVHFPPAVHEQVSPEQAQSPEQVANAAPVLEPQATSDPPASKPAIPKDKIIIPGMRMRSSPSLFRGTEVPALSGCREQSRIE
jgi:hypothetical protein